MLGSIPRSFTQQLIRDGVLVTNPTEFCGNRKHLWYAVNHTAFKILPMVGTLLSYSAIGTLHSAMPNLLKIHVWYGCGSPFLLDGVRSSGAFTVIRAGLWFFQAMEKSRVVVEIVPAAEDGERCDE